MKLKKLLGFFDSKNALEFLKSKELNDLLMEYLSCLKLETAPEKGERRISDDYIILIEEIFQECVVDDSPNIPNGVKLFRICLLEYCLSQSEFNFDISLQLNKLYQSLN